MRDWDEARLAAVWVRERARQMLGGELANTIGWVMVVLLGVFIVVGMVRNPLAWAFGGWMR